MSNIDEEVLRVRADIMSARKQKQRLRELDFFILDNSIRESTVGQLRSHTIENKKEIFKQVKRCGMHSIIVATFSHMTRVDDEFCQWLKDEGEDFSKLFSFSEITEGVKNGTYDTETVPISLRKNKQYGLYNTVFEVDLVDPNVKWDTKFKTRDVCQLIEKWMNWVYDNINKKARILLNFRDFPMCMSHQPKRLLEIVKFLAAMPLEKRMFALAFEDPLGEYMPEELGVWTASVRRVMDENGWSSGRLLIHIHERWDLKTASTLDCLSAGGDGVWASLCEEGAAMGHASSSVILTNLIRLGNKKVLETYNCKEFRKAAIRVTEVTTGKLPHPKQVVYGARAVDLVFGVLGVGDFNLGDFFGETTVNRITTIATPEMIHDHLVNLFGEVPQFTKEMGLKMKEKMLEDLRAEPPRKEEYMSRVGIAILFDRAGGKLTESMGDEIAKVQVKACHHKQIIEEIRELWDFWDAREEKKDDNCLEFDSFYHGFMSPYFGCYRCLDTKAALQAIDMDNDGLVDWSEFLVYIKWALHQYPDTETADEIMSIAFEKGLLPAMRDEKIKHPENHEGLRHVTA